MFVGLVVFLLMAVVLAADLRSDARDNARDEVKDRAADRAKDVARDRARDVARDAVSDRAKEVARERTREVLSERMKDRVKPERLKEIRENERNKLDREGKNELEDNLKRRRAKQDVKERVKEKRERKCESLNDKVERVLCAKERNAVSERALEKARERHALNEKCRKLTGEDRKKCELEINEHYRTVVQERFKDWIKKKRLAAEAGDNETEETETDEGARVRLDALHKKMLAEKLEKLTEEKKKALIQRLSNMIEKGEKLNDLMEKAITKAEEKGHDVSKLQFLLEEYNAALDKAKVLFDDEQYRDALAALNDAKHTYKQFRHVFAELHQKHKRGEKHVEDLTEVVEVPPTPDETTTDTEGDS